VSEVEVGSGLHEVWETELSRDYLKGQKTNFGPLTHHPLENDVCFILPPSLCSLSIFVIKLWIRPQGHNVYRLGAPCDKPKLKLVGFEITI
jgi:hypothetical protein